MRAKAMPFILAEALRRAMQVKKVRMMTTILRLGNYDVSCTLDNDHDAHGIPGTGFCYTISSQ